MSDQSDQANTSVDKTTDGPRRLASGLVATWVVQLMGTIAVFGVPVLAPEIAPEMNVEATLVGTFVAITYFTAQVSGLLSGGLMDRYGALRMSQASCLFAALGIVLLLPASPWLAIASAVAMGACYGPLNPTSSKILRGLGSDRRQPLIFSVKQTGVPMAGVLVGILLPVLTLEFGWRVGFGVFAVIAVIVAIALQPIRETFDHSRNRGGGRPEIKIIQPLLLVLRERNLRAVTIIGFALAGSQICLGAFFVLFLIQSQGYSLVDAGLMYAVVQAGGIGGRVMWGGIAKQLLSPTAVLFGISCLVCGLFIAIAAMTPAWPIWIVVALALTLGLCSFGWNGVWLSEIADLSPNAHLGDATGGAQFIMFGGVTVLPPVFGALVEWGDSYVLPFVAAGVFVLLVAVYLVIVRRSGAAAIRSGRINN